jgi:hypothetical protein
MEKCFNLCVFFVANLMNQKIRDAFYKSLGICLMRKVVLKWRGSLAPPCDIRARIYPLWPSTATARCCDFFSQQPRPPRSPGSGRVPETSCCWWDPTQVLATIAGCSERWHNDRTRRKCHGSTVRDISFQSGSFCSIYSGHEKRKQIENGRSFLVSICFLRPAREKNQWHAGRPGFDKFMGPPLITEHDFSFHGDISWRRMSLKPRSKH